ncbi:MAG: type II toxin-antitoxin system VapC family toxin [Chamaesiphon sp.]|nr:type II toxin-antitoxin system VapC family toxin [Chamaesiphon sp.]
MTLFILDTDSASLFLGGNQQLIYRVTQEIPDVVTTIVTVQELFNGWAGRVNDPAEANNLVRIYGKLWQTTEFLKTIEILTFSELANTYHQNLILEHKTLAKKRLEKDMRIAAIALSVSGTIITRNHKYFSQVPALKNDR